MRRSPTCRSGYAGALHWRRAELGPSLACGQTHYLSIHRGLLRSRAVSAPDAARRTERNRLFGEDELQVLSDPGGMLYIKFNLTKELGPRRITADVVPPGPVQTDFSGGMVQIHSALA